MRLASVGYLLLWLLAGYVTLKYLVPYVLPFVLAVALALILDPLVNLLEAKCRLPRGLAVAVSITGFLGGLILILTVVMTTLLAEVAELSRFLPQYYRQAEIFVGEMMSRLNLVLSDMPPQAADILDAQLANMYQYLESTLYTLLQGLRRFFGGVPNAMVVSLVSVVAGFFFSRDKRQIARFLLALAPRAWREKLLEAKTQILFSTLGFIKAQLILVGITAGLSFVGLSIIGVEYALTLGLLAGLLDIFPMVGPSLIFVPWGVYELLSGDYALALKLGALLGITSLVRQVAEAKIIGERIGVHPLATLLAVYLGIRFFGPSGFIVGPMAVIVLKAVVKTGLLPLFPEQRRA